MARLSAGPWAPALSRVEAACGVPLSPFSAQVPNPRGVGEIRGCSRSVDVAAVGDVYHRYNASLVVDSVDDPVCTTARATPVVHRRKQPLPDPVGVQQQRAGDELAGSGRDGFR